MNNSNLSPQVLVVPLDVMTALQSSYDAGVISSAQFLLAINQLAR
jgi:hypothetical protein